MASSTISSHVYHGVTFDNVTYFSPLTVTSTGIVTPVNGDAVYASSGYGAATIVNRGVITGGSGGDGVDLKDGGNVNNQGGTITGSYGVYLSLNASSLTNTGRIIGTERDGVAAGNGVNVNNIGTAALIEGSIYGIFDFGASTVMNEGTIAASGFGPGIGLGMGGSVDNLGTAARIESYTGVRGIGVTTITNAGVIIGTGSAGAYLHAGGTVIDSGTINGGAGTAIYLGGTGNDRLVLEQGYSLGGGVSVVGTGNVVGLLGTAGAVTLDFDKAGAGFTQFGTFDFGTPSGNDETLKISNTLAAPGTIASFNAPHEIVDLTQIDPTGAVVQFDTISNIMTISNGSQSATLQLDAEDYSTVSWSPTPDGSGGTDVAVVCYCRGTRILTPDGEVPIEDLAIGDQVLTLSGEAKPIKWIGWRSFRGQSVAGNRNVLPVRIAANAFEDGVPKRDLAVSPDHAIFVDGKLICARQLVNRTTIWQDQRWAQIDYYHLELAEHAILLAEGLPAESYLDTGNRSFFADSGTPMLWCPDLTDETGHPTRSAGSCAPFVWDEASVQPVWQHLAIRAAALGRPVCLTETTQDSGLRIVANGRTQRPVHSSDGQYTFVVPKGTREVRLVSRSAMPIDARPWLEDRRRLGVLVSRITLRGGCGRMDVPLDSPSIHRGWWAVERERLMLRRWTTGDAVLPLPVGTDPCVLELRVGTLAYPLRETLVA